MSCKTLILMIAVSAVLSFPALAQETPAAPAKTFPSNAVNAQATPAKKADASVANKAAPDAQATPAKPAAQASTPPAKPQTVAPSTTTAASTPPATPPAPATAATPAVQDPIATPYLIGAPYDGGYTSGPVPQTEPEADMDSVTNNPTGEGDLKNLFNQIDTDHNGMISETEFSIYYKTTNEDPRFLAYDTNRDTFISYFEFRKPNVANGKVILPTN